MYGKSVLLCRVARVTVRNYKHDSTKRLLEFLADMPKANTTRIAESQRQRQQIAKKSEKYGPSCVYLQVLGSGARGAPNTLYMFTDQKRYLFNCGEQTQRLAHEHKVKLSRLDHIFITSKTWKNIGGLPGLSLTLQDVGVPHITLHGPERLDELYAATKRFVIMKDMRVTMAKCSPNEDFEDNVMSVKYVVLSPNDQAILPKDPKPAAKRPRIAEPIDKSYEEFMHDSTDYYRRETGGDSPTKKALRDRRVKSPISPIKKRTDKVLNDLQKMTHCTVSYICTLKKRLGTLDLAKCVERGVKPGPLLGQLKNGQDVVLPDGTLVLSSDVKTPDDPGPVFIVLDVPDITYLKEQDFSAHFADGENPPENIPTLIVHYTPPSVFHDPEYQKFISLFGQTPRHLILNGQNSCLGSEAVHRTQHKLHLLDPDIFPLLKDVSVPAVWNAHPPLLKTASPVRLKGLEELKNKIALAQFQNIINMEGSREHRPRADCSQDEGIELIAARALTVFHLRPKRQLDRSAEPKLHIQDYIQETMDVDGFVGSLEQFRRLVDSIRYAKRVSSSEYPKVVFLGTGSCIPSKTRNTSSIVVHIDETRSILLDCGEGTFSQLVRFYGPKRVNAFLRTLRAIYISHLHADHHIGLIGVLQARRQAYDEISCSDHSEPVHLLAPGQIMSWLTVYDQQFERIRAEFTLLPNQLLLMDSTEASTEMTSAVLAKLGVSSIKTCHVPHCPNAFGVAMEIGQHKITYSGDTLPTDSLVKLGQDSTLLIHEATMEDELAEEARMKMHSTTTQAIDIGRKMNARYTVLTHFSQRYARLPRLNANILHDNSSVGIAFDNMQITMSDLELLPHMYAPLQLMFAEHCVEMELKAANRARQKQREQARRLADSDGKETDDRKRQKCKGSSSAHNNNQHVGYKESLSSKLRIEGAVSRRLPSPGGRCDKSRSPSRVASRIPSKTGTSGQSTPCPDGPAPPRGTETFNTPRTLSLTSNATRDDSGSCDDYVIDTRSKTLNAVTPAPLSRPGTPAPLSRPGTPAPLSRPATPAPLSRPSTPAPLSRQQNAEANHIRKTQQSALRTEQGKQDDLKSSAPAGYGKPLVTPVDKRLTLQRDYPQLTKAVILQKAYHSQDKSPSRSLPSKIIDNKQTNSVAMSGYKTPTMRVPSSKSRVPSISDVRVKSKSPARSPVSVRGLKGSASSQNRQHSPQSGRCTAPKTNSVNSVDSAKPRWRDPSASNCSSSGLLSSRNYKGNKGDEVGFEGTTKSRLNDAIKHYAQRTAKDYDTGSSTRPCTPRFNVKHDSSKLAENAEDRFNVKAVYHTKRTPLFEKIRTGSFNKPNNAVHSIRSFKPQLEDIKSSFLLLNKIHQSRKENIKSKMDKDISKPKVLNEEERRQKLMEVKRSFQTKRFWHDSKYDKIEGLNWISWK